MPAGHEKWVTLKFQVDGTKEGREYVVRKNNKLKYFAEFWLCREWISCTSHGAWCSQVSHLRIRKARREIRCRIRIELGHVVYALHVPFTIFFNFIASLIVRRKKNISKCIDEKIYERMEHVMHQKCKKKNTEQKNRNSRRNLMR